MFIELVGVCNVQAACGQVRFFYVEKDSRVWFFCGWFFCFVLFFGDLILFCSFIACEVTHSGAVVIPHFLCFSTESDDTS